MTAWLEEAGHLLRLARRDHQTFCILLDSGRAALAPICFHAQQAAEKALKAVLTVQQRDFPRTHSLSELARLVQDSGLAPPCNAADYLRLAPFAVEFRYDERAPVGRLRHVNLYLRARASAVALRVFGLTIADSAVWH